jgi:hypothetical protein
MAKDIKHGCSYRYNPLFGSSEQGLLTPGETVRAVRPAHHNIETEKSGYWLVEARGARAAFVSKGSLHELDRS